MIFCRKCYLLKNSATDAMGVIFHPIPKDEYRRNKCLAFLGLFSNDIDKTSISSICSGHFEPRFITFNGRLKLYAVPTIESPEGFENANFNYVTEPFPKPTKKSTSLKRNVNTCKKIKSSIKTENSNSNIINEPIKLCDLQPSADGNIIILHDSPCEIKLIKVSEFELSIDENIIIEEVTPLEYERMNNTQDNIQYDGIVNEDNTQSEDMNIKSENISKEDNTEYENTSILTEFTSIPFIDENIINEDHLYYSSPKVTGSQPINNTNKIQVIIQPYANNQTILPCRNNLPSVTKYRPIQPKGLIIDQSIYDKKKINSTSQKNKSKSINETSCTFRLSSQQKRTKKSKTNKTEDDLSSQQKLTKKSKTNRTEDDLSSQQKLTKKSKTNRTEDDLSSQQKLTKKSKTNKTEDDLSCPIQLKKKIACVEKARALLYKKYRNVQKGVWKRKNRIKHLKNNLKYLKKQISTVKNKLKSAELNLTDLHFTRYQTPPKS